MEGKQEFCILKFEFSILSFVFSILVLIDIIVWREGEQEFSHWNAGSGCSLPPAPPLHQEIPVDGRP